MSAAKKTFHFKTVKEMAELPNCKYDSLGTCEDLPKDDNDIHCIRCLMMGIDMALCRENIGLAMNHLKILQQILEKNGYMTEEEEKRGE